MDFYNNAKGREFGALYNFFTPSNTIKITVLYQLSGGTLKYLAPLNENPNNLGDIIPGVTTIRFTNQ